MSEAKVNSEDLEMVFQRLRALSGNKVNIFRNSFMCIVDSYMTGHLKCNSLVKYRLLTSFVSHWYVINYKIQSCPC